MGTRPGPVTMDSYSRQQADRLVNRLLSEPGPERARILAQEDPSFWDSIRLQAIRESLRAARLRGRLTDGAYEEALAQVERWHQFGEAANTSDLPSVPFAPSEPTIELNSHSLQRTDRRRDVSPDAAASRVAGESKREAAGEEPPISRYPAAHDDEALSESGSPSVPLPDLDRTAVLHEGPRVDTASLADAVARWQGLRAEPSLRADSVRRPESLLRSDPQRGNATADDDDEATQVRSAPPASPPPLRSEPVVPSPRTPQRPAGTLIAPTSPSQSASSALAPQVASPSQPIKQPAAAARPESTAVAPAVSPPGPAGLFVPGATIRGRYVLESQIGNGGSGIVFRARDLRRDELDRDAFVALKVPREHLRDREDVAERLKREFDQSQALPHPNIVRVFDIDCEQGTWFLTMELLDGESLSTLLACLHPRRLPEREALAIINGCGRALAFAHENGVLHGDLKPGNIFVTRSEQVFVLDFGVIGPTVPGRDLSLASRATMRASAATPCYASPEVLSGQPPDERDDVFSLACLAYEVLTGRHPFDRHSTLEARDRRLGVRRAPGLSRHQFAAVERGLAWSRSRRPNGVMAFLAALGIAQPEPDAKGWFGAVAAACIGAIAAAGILSLDRGDRASDESARPSSSSADAVRGIAGAPGGAAPEIPAQPSNDPSVSSSERASERRGAQGSPPGTDRAAAIQSGQANATSTPAAGSAAPTTDPSAGGSATAARAAAPGGRVSLEQASIVVNERAVSVVVRVRRLEDLRGRVRIQWRAIPGSAAPGLDYSRTSACCTSPSSTTTYPKRTSPSTSSCSH